MRELGNRFLLLLICLLNLQQSLSQNCSRVGAGQRILFEFFGNNTIRNASVASDSMSENLFGDLILPPQATWNPDIGLNFPLGQYLSAMSSKNMTDFFQAVREEMTVEIWFKSQSTIFAPWAWLFNSTLYQTQCPNNQWADLTIEGGSPGLKTDYSNPLLIGQCIRKKTGTNSDLNWPADGYIHQLTLVSSTGLATTKSYFNTRGPGLKGNPSSPLPNYYDWRPGVFDNYTFFLFPKTSYYDFGGDVFRLAVYDRALIDTEINQNWLAWLPNKAPVGFSGNASIPEYTCTPIVVPRDDFDFVYGPDDPVCGEHFNITIYQTRGYGRLYRNEADCIARTPISGTGPISFDERDPVYFLTLQPCGRDFVCAAPDFGANYSEILFGVIDYEAEDCCHWLTLNVYHVPQPPRPVTPVVVITDLYTVAPIQLSGYVDFFLTPDVITCFVARIPTKGRLYINVTTDAQLVTEEVAMVNSTYNSTTHQFDNTTYFVNVTYWVNTTELMLVTNETNPDNVTYWNTFINSTDNSTYQVPALWIPYCKLYYEPTNISSGAANNGGTILDSDTGLFGLFDGTQYNPPDSYGALDLRILNPIRPLVNPESYVNEDNETWIEFQGESLVGTFSVTVVSPPRQGIFKVAIGGGNITTFPYKIGVSGTNPSGNRVRLVYLCNNNLFGLNMESISYYLTADIGGWRSANGTQAIHVLPVNDPPVLRSNLTTQSVVGQHLEDVYVAIYLTDPDMNPYAFYEADIIATVNISQISLSDDIVPQIQEPALDYLLFYEGDGDYDQRQYYRAAPRNTGVNPQTLVNISLVPIRIRCSDRGDEFVSITVNDSDPTFPGPLTATYMIWIECEKPASAFPSSLSDTPVLVLMWLLLAFVPLLILFCVCNKKFFMPAYAYYKRLPGKEPREDVALDKLATPTAQPETPQVAHEDSGTGMDAKYHTPPGSASPDLPGAADSPPQQQAESSPQAALAGALAGASLSGGKSRKSRAVESPPQEGAPQEGVVLGASLSSARPRKSRAGKKKNPANPWRRYTTDDGNNRIYYYNKQTGQSQWVAPDEYEEGNTTDEEAGEAQSS